MSLMGQSLSTSFSTSPSFGLPASPHKRVEVLRTFSTSSRGMFERLLGEECSTEAEDEMQLHGLHDGTVEPPSPLHSPNESGKNLDHSTASEQTPLLDDITRDQPAWKKWANILLYGLINSVIMVPVMISYAAIMYEQKRGRIVSF